MQLNQFMALLQSALLNNLGQRLTEEMATGIATTILHRAQEVLPVVAPPPPATDPPPL